MPDFYHTLFLFKEKTTENALWFLLLMLLPFLHCHSLVLTQPKEKEFFVKFSAQFLMLTKPDS